MGDLRLGSIDYWRAVSIWDQPQLSSADVAAMLGVTAAAVRQLLRRRDSTGFPLPAVAGARPKWSPAQIYEYVRERRPRKLVVPSLFPDLTGNLVQSATFVAAEQWETRPTPILPNPEDGSVVVQYWRPSVGRDTQIVIVYPAAPGREMSRAAAVRVAILLARDLFALSGPAAEVVAMVTDELRPTPDGGQQAAIVVVERGPRAYPPTCTYDAARRRVATAVVEDVSDGDGAMSVYEVGWFDLGSMIRIDLPWWPPSLRSMETIAQWRPGVAPVAVPLASRDYRPDVLGALAKAALDLGSSNAALLKDVVERANRRIEEAMYRQSDNALQLPGACVSPARGIVQAAVPAFVRAELPEQLAVTEIAWLLRQPSRGDSRGASILFGLPETKPVMAQTRHLAAHSRGPLAQEWASRLEPAENWTVAHEFVRKHGSRPADANTSVSLIDPFNQASWAVRTDTGDIHYIVGTRALGAVGQLVEAEIDETMTTFFRDSAGNTWPLPYGGSYHDSEAVIGALYTLRKQADADTEHPPVDQREIPGLTWMLRGSPPWRLSRQDVAEYLDV